MVISHTNKFCFFAIPRTASQALSRHLVMHYNGVHTTPMHMSFEEYIKIYDKQFVDYISFATIRNPLDSIISSYLKKKTDHNFRFSRGTFSNGKKIGEKAMDEFHFIRANNASFQEYFIKFHSEEYKIPRHERTVQKVNHVLRFESLQSDFNSICAQQHWPQITIEDFNKTDAPSRSLEDYYTPQIRSIALSTFSRLMKSWNYKFPAGW